MKFKFLYRSNKAVRISRLSYWRIFLYLFELLNSCQDSCNDLCAYQSLCFECPPEEILNLEDLTCVTQCDLTRQILIQDPQLQNIPVCRSFEYFVNANSKSPVELGTKEHPYKDIEAAFSEIMNFHSHNQRNMTVYVMEKSTVFVNSVTFFVNMSHVLIETYNENMLNLGLARMVGIKNGSKIIPPAMPTKFSILAHKQLNLEENIFQNDGFDSVEKSQISQISAVFKPYHCGLIIKNFMVTTDYDGKVAYHAFLEPYRVDSRVVAMIDCEIRIHGSVMKALTTVFNWHMENILIETQYLSRISLLGVGCGESKSDLGTRTYFKNVTTIASGDKPAYLRGESAFRNYAANDIHFEDCHFDSYTGYPGIFAQYIFYLDQTNCFRSIPNIWNFTNIHMTTSRNEEGKNSANIGTNILAMLRTGAILSPLNAYLNNFTVSNDVNNLYGQVGALPTPVTIFHIDGLRFLNSEGFLINLAYVLGANMKNLYFENVTATQNKFLNFRSDNGTRIDGITFKNLTYGKSESSPLVRIICFKDCKSHVKDIKVIDSQVHQRDAIFSITAKSQSTLEVDNAYFEGLNMSGDTPIIAYGIFKNITITNIHVFRSHSANDGNHFLIQSSYTSQGLSPNNTKVFKNILAEESTLSLISVSKPDGYTDSEEFMTITNVTYRNSESPVELDVIKIYRMSTVGTYSIALKDIVFSNLTFQKESSLLLFGQQLMEPATVTNLTVYGVNKAGITIQSSDSSDIYEKTHVTFTNIKGEHNDGMSRSLINIFSGADIEIIDSEFSFNGNYQKGAVLTAGSSKAIATVRNSVFWNNTSVEGGVFETESLSNIKCFNCSFYNNFAVTGGVIKASADGIFEFYNCTVFNNFAFQGSAFELFSTQFESIVDNTNVTGNIGISKEQIMSDFFSQGYVYQTLKDYVANNSYIFENSGSFSCFKMIMAQISITNSNFINQEGILSATGSRIAINNSLVKDTLLSSDLFSIIESDVTLDKLKILNSICQAISSEVFYFVATFAEIKNLDYSESNCRLMNLGFSQVSMQGIEVRNITLGKVSLIKMLKSKSVGVNNDGKEVPTLIVDSKFTNISTEDKGILMIKNSIVRDMRNISLTEIHPHALVVEKSDMENIEDLNFNNNDGCISALESTFHLILHSQFSNCGSSNLTNGGAIQFVDSSSRIEGSEFKENQAKVGAGISIQCKLGKSCKNEFTDLYFSNNSAAEMGGSIFYNSVRPILAKIHYDNNTAKYGPNIASYAVKIIQRGTNTNKIYLNNIASGQDFPDTLSVDLVDIDDQIMNLESSNAVKILTEDPRIKAKGSDSGRLVNGKAEIKNIVFVGEVGFINTKFLLTSKSINQRIINEVLNNLKGEYDNYIEVSFRHCKPGEIQTKDKQCSKCHVRTYTFDWNSTSCINCMENADCNGEDQISVDKGYWRKSTNSSSIIKCLNFDACLGEYHPNNEHPVKCKTGYRGMLCSVCDIVDGKKYQPLSNFRCAKCPEPFVNTIRVIAVCIGAFCFQLLLIYVNLRKKKESEMSILFRIITNYLHLVSSFFLFNLQLPNSMVGLFSFMSWASSPDETFFSFDCFITDHELKFFAPSNYLFKMFMYIFFPILLLLAIATLFCAILIVHRGIQYFKNKARDIDMPINNLFQLKRSLIVSCICVIFMFHPALTVKSLSLLLCTEIDDGDFRMTHHLDYTCWSWSHIQWVIFVALPILIIWVIGLPGFALYFLIKNRKNLIQPQMQSYFLILYQGFKEERFYWEFVSAFRKFLILSIHSLLNTVPPYYKLGLSVVCLIFFFYFQNYMKPFKSEANNEIDLLALSVGTVTIYGGIIFQMGEDSYPFFYRCTIFLVVSCNSYFILNWAYLLMKLTKWKNPKYIFIKNLLGFILCKGVKSSIVQKEDDESPKGPIKKLIMKGKTKGTIRKSHKNKHLKGLANAKGKKKRRILKKRRKPSWFPEDDVDPPIENNEMIRTSSMNACKNSLAYAKPELSQNCLQETTMRFNQKKAHLLPSQKRELKILQKDD
ncbi:unnamed protein product [Moneuplotes crassus]|uniref:Uncharacterized protein n=1 Tax=Euplotes crassus TaxID=5936 RepID=A0AAD1U9G7_EUPCR|nr:unnamed protein product [Moneuplotes crassus]